MKKLNTGDWIEFEERTGQKISDVLPSEGQETLDLSLKTSAVLVWLFERRQGNDVTYEQVLERDLDQLLDGAIQVFETMDKEPGENPTSGEVSEKTSPSSA